MPLPPTFMKPSSAELDASSILESAEDFDPMKEVEHVLESAQTALNKFKDGVPGAEHTLRDAASQLQRLHASLGGEESIPIQERIRHMLEMMKNAALQQGCISLKREIKRLLIDTHPDEIVQKRV